MKRRACLSALVAACCAVARADPTPAERARIERLLAAVAKRTDIRFLRNGKEYDSVQAADFLRGKYGWRIEKVATVQDFIEQIGTRSTSSDEIYKVRLADGRIIPNADFLVQELRRLEKR